MKTKLMTMILVQTLLFGALFESCKPPPARQFTINQTSIDYCLFETGSYWIYRELGSYEKDTITIVSSERINVNIEDVERHEGFEQTWISSRVGKIQVWIGPSAGNPSIDVVSEMYIRPPVAWDIHTFISLRDSSKYYSPFQNTKTQFVESFDSIRVCKAMFSDVILLHSNGGYHANPPIEIVWAKGVGKIEQINFHGDQWVLEEYKVDQKL